MRLVWPYKILRVQSFWFLTNVNLLPAFVMNSFWYTVANVPSLKVICRIMLNGYVKHASNKSMLRLL
ncbi:Uncharacterised protein [Acinetobacter baumannii]|nr:Uncharacterised protein [Acinetobacter baumannii]